MFTAAMIATLCLVPLVAKSLQVNSKSDSSPKVATFLVFGPADPNLKCKIHVKDLMSCIFRFFLPLLCDCSKVRPFLNNLSLPSFFPQRVVMVKTNERLGVQIVNISEFLWVPFGPTFRIWKLLSSKGLDLSGTITPEEPSTPRDFKPQVSKIQPQIKMNRFFFA